MSPAQETATWDRVGCSVAGTLGVVGEKWTLLVLREAFLGVRRFADLQRNLGAPKAVLTDRLATLVGQGVLERVPYQAEGERQRHEYRLTPKGIDLYPTLVALMEWSGHLSSPTVPLFGFEGRAPQVHPGAWIAPTATLIGDVVVEDGASIWYGVVLRADFGRIVVRAGANVQDNSVLHGGNDPETEVG